MNPRHQTISAHKACGNERLFPDHQVTRQVNLLGLSSHTVDIIMSGHIVIKLAHERPTNSGTLLIDRVQQRICNILDAMLRTALQPPPPIPTTLMMPCIVSLISSAKNGIVSSPIITQFFYPSAKLANFSHTSKSSQALR